MTFNVNGDDGKLLDQGTVDVLWNGKHEHLDARSKVFHGELPHADDAFAAGILREAFLLRQLLDQTIRPVPSFSGAHDLDTSEKKRTFGKVQLNCLAVARGKGLDPADEFCTEISNADLLRVHIGQGFSMVRNRMGMFQGTSVALDNTINYAGKVAIEGHTETLKTVTAAESEAVGAEADPSPIPGVINGRRLHGNAPAYPLVAREQHIKGSVVMAAVISKTGQIKDLVVIGSPDGSLTQSAMDAVKTWTYTPYMVGGDPQEVQTTITVNYNLSSV